MALPEKPLTRTEYYLSKMAGKQHGIPKRPLTRKECYLDALVNAITLSGEVKAADFAGLLDAVNAVDQEVRARVTSLNTTPLMQRGSIVDAVGILPYIKDVSQYPTFNLTDEGWYAFARITSKDGTVVSGNTTIDGAAGYVKVAGNDYVDVAVFFDNTAISQVVTVNWNSGYTDTFVFKATDLAIRNLDYLTTFYEYDIDDKIATWEYALTEDTTFAADKYYYTKNGDDYSLANVTVGDAIPADTYYKHTKVTFANMTRNVTYRCNTVIDCPVTFILPEIPDDGHGAWFEFKLRHAGNYSSTLVPPEGVKVATEHTQAETKGINVVDLLYSNVGGAKLWRFTNQHSTIPA